MPIERALAGIDGLMLTGGNDIAPARYGEASHDTVVACDNDVRDAGKGASNIRCTP